jgi:hypothetical protein
MEEQGNDMYPLVLYQENMSVILLEPNGKVSSTKQIKHIKVKYFYIKKKVNNGEIYIEHCPTGQMWMDINTKQNKVWCTANFKAMSWGHPWITMTKITKESFHPFPQSI